MGVLLVRIGADYHEEKEKDFTKSEKDMKSSYYFIIIVKYCRNTFDYLFLFSNII